ncbi:hypothetical protein WR25_22489 [Diploscapter pachys]|uniref:Uncharacterized protein n=1 Tax=Diploscapter pachys TaxID=2018661 RepID=A0A2A2LEH9_9BILA|nr:hypothetical protein WR25_22489 [Diploscapter pachys]
MNTSKTEYLELEPRTPGDIELDGTKLPRANDFKYLGDRISADGESLSAVKGRIDAAWLKWRQCSGVLCDRKMPTKLKSRIYRTVMVWSRAATRPEPSCKDSMESGVGWYPTPRKTEDTVH